ncbi:uncharacterized protein [Primulina huaijiensis]|uniref:uncharacterized protein n=1 Tax=Primulina huaijiensis TaxID=1492673 RepID=UPI003CC7862E
MDFFSKFTKPADHSKPASKSQEPNITTEPSNTDLFSSAKVVAGASQSYFSHQPATYENTEVAGATADILNAASEYGKLDKTQGVGKYVDQAESYLKEYESSNTKPAATSAADTASDAGVKVAPTTEAAETDIAATKGADASTEESTKHKSYVEDKTEGLSSKPPAVDAPVKTDTSDVYGEDKADGLPNKTSGGSAATETDAIGEYIDIQASGGGGATTKTDVSDAYQQPKVDKYEESTEEDFRKKPTAAATDTSEYHAKGTEEGISDKPSSGCLAAGTDAGDSGYADSEESLPKNSAGGYAAGDDASEKVSQSGGGFGNFTKVAGDFLNK